MDAIYYLKQIAAGALLSGGLAFTGLEPAMATAHADTFPPHHWCPGQSKNLPNGPGEFVNWDWTVCHTWYGTQYGMGNVNYVWGAPASVWDGDNPPVEAITPRQCPPIAFMCP